MLERTHRGLDAVRQHNDRGFTTAWRWPIVAELCIIKYGIFLGLRAPEKIGDNRGAVMLGDDVSYNIRYTVLGREFHTVTDMG